MPNEKSEPIISGEALDKLHETAGKNFETTSRIAGHQAAAEALERQTRRAIDEAVVNQNRQTALALVEKWHHDPESHRISDMLTVGGAFIAFRHAMRAHTQAVRNENETPQSPYEVLVSLIETNPDFAAALATHGDKPFDHQSHTGKATDKQPAWGIRR